MARRADLLEFAILGLLHEGPTHGYDLRRRLNSALGPFRALSYGSLYPALRALTDRGLIAHVDEPGMTPLSTGARAAASARPRISYQLTAEGKEHFETLRRREQADSWSAALAQHAEEGTEREVRWLSELIDAEKRHPQDPGPQP